MAEDTRERQITRVTLWGAAVNCVLTACKMIAGIAGNSAAMLADGVHSFSDLVSDFVVLVFVRISAKGQDSKHDYGHGKFETLATLIVSILMLVAGARLFSGGIASIMSYLDGAELPQPGLIALWMALLSIVVKEILYQITVRVGRSADSPAVIANAWHHRSDAVSSVGSLIGIGGAILLGKRWTVLDPIAGCLISIFIFVIAAKMAGTAIRELMETSLNDTEEKEITDLILSVDGIESVHDLKTRRNGRSVIIDVHIVVDAHITVHEAHEMTVRAEEYLRDRFGEETQIFIHVEPDENAR